MMIPFLSGMIFVWVAVIIISLAIEAATYELTAIWFGVGALIALIAATLGASQNIQLVIFVVASAICILLLRPFVRKFLKPKGAKTNADRIIGEEAIVTEAIDNTQATGAIKIMGQVWTARSADGVPIPKGERVRICEISGVKAIVLRA